MTIPHPGSYLYVCGPEQHLIGVVRFRSLVLARADQPVADLMEDEAVTVSPLTDAEEAANLFIDRRVRKVPPVVDGDGRLLGILTEDEAFGILDEEATKTLKSRAAPLRSKCRTCAPHRGCCGANGSFGCCCCSSPRPTRGRCCAPSPTRWRRWSRSPSSSRC